MKKKIVEKSIPRFRVGEGDLTIGVGVRDDGQEEGLLHHLGLAEDRGGVNSSHLEVWSGVVGYCVMVS